MLCCASTLQPLPVEGLLYSVARGSLMAQTQENSTVSQEGVPTFECILIHRKP